MISRTVKVKIFPYFKILNFRSDDVTFLRNAETAILTENEREDTTTLVALTRTTLSVIANRTKIEIKENDNELQRTFQVATIVQGRCKQRC